MKLLPCVAFALMLPLFQLAHADDACSGFKWDVKHEHTLFIHEGRMATAGKDDKSAPMLDVDRLYLLGLSPQENVKFATPPAKKMLADGASAGLVHFRIAKAGQYRVSVDVPFWIDAVVDGKSIPSIDFNGAQGCTAPRKIVVYDLPATPSLTLQFSGSTEARGHITLTPVPAAKQ
ncbi:MAG TPA: hypothetical protein VGC55_16720 [Dokdonella sp.]